MSMGDRICLTLAALWTASTVVSLAVITVVIVKEPAFPLGLGLIRTQGLSGLWITVPSISLGTAGLILLTTRRTIGARVLLFYSFLWSLVLLPGMLSRLPAIVRHPIAYCTSGTCTPWVIKVAITVAFILSTAWYARQAHRQLG
jgi:hypothetical protein